MDSLVIFFRILHVLHPSATYEFWFTAIDENPLHEGERVFDLPHSPETFALSRKANYFPRSEIQTFLEGLSSMKYDQESYLLNSGSNFVVNGI
jgi:hypothetical protein